VCTLKIRERGREKEPWRVSPGSNHGLAEVIGCRLRAKDGDVDADAESPCEMGGSVSLYSGRRKRGFECWNPS